VTAEDEAMISRELLSELTAERERFLQAIDGLTEDEMTRPDVVGDWSVKDILGHIASWEEAAAYIVRGIAQGQHPDTTEYDDEDAWNAQQVARKRDWPLTRIRAELSAARRSLLDAIIALPGRLPPDEETLVLDWVNTQHDREHRADILAWRERMRI
jgi:uncharacterized damage-inducible protein DinB